MRRLRESWLALGGSALIIALSVSSALGAGPALDAIDSVGEQVSEFARSLAPGQNETADEPDAEEQPDNADEDAVDTDADALDADTDALLAELAPGDEGFDWTSIGHGACVSWHAQQDENADSDEDTSAEEGTEGEEDSDEPLVAGDEGYVWGNHGEFVSFWATEGCYEEPEEEEATEEEEEATEEEEEVTDETLEPGDEDFDWTTVSHGFCVSWHAHEDETSEDNAPEDGGSWTNHGDFVSHWAQEGCRTAPEDSDEAGVDSAEADTEVDEDSGAKAEEKAARKAEQAERKADRKAARRGRG